MQTGTVAPIAPASANVLGSNAVGQLTAQTYANVVALFSTCSGTQYLGADGNCYTAAVSPTTNQNLRTIGAVLTPTALTSCVYVAFAGTINAFHAVAGDGASVLARPLCWDGRVLALGEPATRTVRHRRDGLAFVHPLEPGDHVSLHWDFVCDVLSPRAELALARATRRALAAVNRAGSVAPALC